MTRADAIKAFLDDAHGKGLTVYFQTHLRTWKVAPKHAALTRVHNGHFEILLGKQGWVSVNYTRITAQ